MTTPHRESLKKTASRTPSHRRIIRLHGLIGALITAAIVAAAASPAQAIELHFTTGNDFLTFDNQDDLYTFSAALSAERGPYTITLRENAFTDRQAGERFDETHLTARRAVPGLGNWKVNFAAGAVHVGRGLLGQGTQNSLHLLLGDDQLDLRYVRARLYPSLGVEVERPFPLGAAIDVSPRLEAETIPGFQSHAALGARVHWRTTARIAVEAFAGARWSDASLALLDRHLDRLAPIARVGVSFKNTLFVAWTYNDFGDRREHLSVGFRIAPAPHRATAGDLIDELDAPVLPDEAGPASGDAAASLVSGLGDQPLRPNLSIRE